MHVVSWLLAVAVFADRSSTQPKELKGARQ
jgi:hypothetical protein